jgi:hypothetical protein
LVEKILQLIVWNQQSYEQNDEQDRDRVLVAPIHLHEDRRRVGQHDLVEPQL